MRQRVVCAILVWAIGLVASLRADPIRVATFNVRNYLPTDRVLEAGYRPAYPKPEIEKTALRAVIRACRPDVLALQEMGSTPYLEEFRQDLAREGDAFDYAIVLAAADPDRHVAVLSRVPFAAVHEHREIPIEYFGERTLVKRGLLEITFATPDAGGWTLFVLHLKSRLTNRDDDPRSAQRRLLEARALRDVILTRFPEPGAARFLVVGDFNDTKNSRPLAAMVRRGSTTITGILPTVDSRGEAWTHHHRPADEYTRVDFALASPGLQPFVVGGSGTIFDGAGAADASDHRLVYVDLEFSPQSPGRE